MRSVTTYIKEYFYETDKRILVIVSFFAAILVFINYQYHLDEFIREKRSLAVKLFAWYIVFLFAFAFPYLIYRVLGHRKYILHKKFISLLLLAPAIFSFKICFDISLHVSANNNWNSYWNLVFHWPVLMIITGTILFITWKIYDRQQPFYGITTKNINWRPYLLMLLFVIPLVAAASTQPDFLRMYPRLQMVEQVYHEEGMRWWHKLLFEISYGTDFITIELFFRGFLILAFIKWAGKDAILPMACFYCTIHFGKPLGECISSYFGGMLLGIVVYNTRSIFGGLIVHLGIAWMMELGGYLGGPIIK
jgi:hypothetical protein